MIDTLTIVKIILGFLFTVSFTGTALWWFITFTANTLADTYKKKVEHDFKKELEFFRSELEIVRTIAHKYNDKQFDLYIDLWKNLQDLKFASIDLWKIANPTNLGKFEVALRKTHRQIETTSILLEEKHYIELSKIITTLQEYDMGKVKLMAVKQGNVNQMQIDQLVLSNGQLKDRCLEIIEKLKDSIKSTITGRL